MKSKVQSKRVYSRAVRNVWRLIWIWKFKKKNWPVFRLGHFHCASIAPTWKIVWHFQHPHSENACSQVLFLKEAITMKHVIVVDESGMPVYYDHKDGLMLCPIISAVYNIMKGSFEETIRSWSCGKTRFFLKTVCFISLVQTMRTSYHFFSFLSFPFAWKYVSLLFVIVAISYIIIYFIIAHLRFIFYLRMH